MAKRVGLKLFRIKKNLYQQEIADKCGISVSMYCCIENGERKGSFKFWNRLQSEFGLTDKEVEKLKKG